MFISVPRNITFHSTSSTQNILRGPKIESSLLILQKRVICPRIHSSKEQKLQLPPQLLPWSPCSLNHTLYVCLFSSISSLRWWFISWRAQFPFCYTHGYFMFEKWRFLWLPLLISTHAAYLSVLNSCLCTSTWPTSGQHPRPGANELKREVCGWGWLWTMLLGFFPTCKLTFANRFREDRVPAQSVGWYNCPLT